MKLERTLRRQDVSCLDVRGIRGRGCVDNDVSRSGSYLRLSNPRGSDAQCRDEQRPEDHSQSV
jgi:hypothetical protein